MRRSFVFPSGLSRRTAQHARVASLTEEIQLLERASKSVQSDREIPAAYGPVQRLRGSILEGELARTRAELDALRTGLPTTNPGSTAPEREDKVIGDAEISGSSDSQPVRGSIRARILLASLAAVAVLLGVAKLPLGPTPEAHASEVLSSQANWEAPSAASEQPVAAPQSEGTFGAPAPVPSEQRATPRGLSLPAIDHFEGWAR